MFDSFMDSIKRILKSRLFPISLIYLGLFSILIHRIFVLQIVKGDYYEQESESKSVKTRQLRSTRGNIYDCNNILLATNELSYVVTFEDTGEISDNKEKNDMIIKLIDIIEEKGGTFTNDFYIRINNKGKFEFTGEEKDILAFKREIYFKRSIEELIPKQRDATAEEVFYYLRDNTSFDGPKFDIGKTLSKENALKVMTIRYAMLINRSNRYIPITVATQVKERAVAAIKENSGELPGVEVVQESHRVYKDSKYFAHMMGYTGAISPELLTEKLENKENYSSSDQMGRAGLELNFDDYLHGKNGYEKVVVNRAQRVVSVKKRVEPIAGNDLYLTIDSKLQKAGYDLLEKKLAQILLSKIHNSTSAGSKGKSAVDIMIPINDVYYSLIKNGIIDITTLNKNDSTDLERNVYTKFKSTQGNVLQDLKRKLSVRSSVLSKNTSKENADFLNYIYLYLKEKEILLTSSIDQDDKQYLAYSDDRLSLSKFLQYAISNNWVDLEKLKVGDKFYSTAELYKKLLDDTLDSLKDDIGFQKKVYRSMINSYKLTGQEICLLLYSQGVLKYDERSISNLKSGSLSSYNFIRSKIESLEITPGQLALEPCSGSIVITDIKTGKVKALVSYPGYNNNKFANIVDPDYFASLNTDSYPLLNRPMQQKTAPGSTYKMLTSIAALEEGVVRPGETVRDLIYFRKINNPPKCWSDTSHGNVDVPNALEVSCNYFFYEMGYRLAKFGGRNFDTNRGLDKLKKYATLLGINAKSGIELPEAQPQVSDTDAVRSAIGQGSNNYTPSQIARYTNALANKGTCYNLTLINQIKDLNGKIVKDNKATIYKKLDFKDTTWSLVHQGMNLVVNGSESSIDHYFSDVNVTVAGKTGTAQQTYYHPNHALFTSFAPYESPEISVTVAIPNGYTSSNAASLASDVYKYYFNKKDRKSLLNKKVNEEDSASPTYTD